MDPLKRARKNFSQKAVGAAPDGDRVMAGPARAGLDDSAVLRLPVRPGPPIQVLDPDSANLGKPYFMLGFDWVGDPNTVLR